MNINTPPQMNEATTHHLHFSDLPRFDDPDCALVTEDPQGHHTFQANQEMTKAILSLLTKL
jgi:hypothetical protein